MATTLLIWDWKVEPDSPEEPALFDDSETNDALTASEFAPTIVKEEHDSTNKAEVFSKLLEEIEDIDQIDEFIKDGEYLYNYLFVE